MSVYIEKVMTIRSVGYDESQRIVELMTQAAIEFESERSDVRYSNLVVKSVGWSKYSRSLVLTVEQERYAR